MKKKFVNVFFLVFLLVLTSCFYTDIVPDNDVSLEIGDDLSFSADIEPIFKTQSCSNCHPGMHQPNLTPGNAYESLIDGGYINEKKPENSIIVTEPSPDGDHAAKLTAIQVLQIIAWIEQGAENN